MIDVKKLNLVFFFFLSFFHFLLLCFMCQSKKFQYYKTTFAQNQPCNFPFFLETTWASKKNFESGNLTCRIFGLSNIKIVKRVNKKVLIIFDKNWCQIAFENQFSMNIRLFSLKVTTKSSFKITVYSDL